MATVRVSFLLGGERFPGRLNRSSVLSDVPAKATRVNRAGPGYKVIRLRRLSHTRQYGTDQAILLRRDGRGQSYPVRLGELLSAQLAAGLVDGPRRRLDLEAVDGPVIYFAALGSGNQGCTALPHNIEGQVPRAIGASVAEADPNL